MARPTAATASVTALALLGLAVAAGAGPRDPLYQWTDSAGITRYTTHLSRIPAGLRDGAQRVLPLDAAELDREIARLEQQIAADEAALGDWLSDPERAADRDALRAVSERLPRHQAELRLLRARREDLRAVLP